jgi:chitin disaccharide deacetylase
LTDATTRYLIVNADDFGRSPGINRGITEAHERGIVTSASLMVRWPAAEEAAAYDGLDLGLHVDLGEWAYRNDRWQALYERVPLEAAEAVAAEVAGQLEKFRRLTGREPSHLDSHQHVHRAEPVAAILRSVATELGAPLRHFSAIRYYGGFYGQSRRGDPCLDPISAESLVEAVRSLSGGITELVCHPGYLDGDVGSYGVEREREVAALCDARVRAALESEAIALCSFAELGKRPVPGSAESVDGEQLRRSRAARGAPG